MYYLILPITNMNEGFWTVGLLQIPKRCEGAGVKGDAKEVAKEVAQVTLGRVRLG